MKPLYQDNPPPPKPSQECLDASIAWLRYDQFSRFDDPNVEVYCVVSDRRVQLYRYKISKLQLKALGYLMKLSGRTLEWVHMNNKTIPTDLVANRELPKLRHWKLVQQKKGKKGRGWWRPTMLAYSFVLGKVKLPKYKFTYNNVLRKRSKKKVSVYSCYEEYFNLDELMNFYIKQPPSSSAENGM